MKGPPQVHPSSPICLRYVERRREVRTGALDRMTEDASSAGIYGGRPEDYAAALKKARKRRTRQDAS